MAIQNLTLGALPAANFMRPSNLQGLRVSAWSAGNAKSTEALSASIMLLRARRANFVTYSAARREW
jgi:hypothetical protein